MDIAGQKRGKKVAMLGLVFQLVLALVMLVVYLQSQSLAALSATWFVAAGVPLWLMAAVLFYCRQLERQEAMELEELSSRPDGGRIFEGEDRTMLRVAANRLVWIHRWVVPAFTLLLAAGNLALGVVALKELRVAVPSLGGASTGILTQDFVFCVLGAFLGLLLSRYCIGMGSQEDYRPLRSAGNFLLINVLAVAAVLACLAFAYFGNARFDTMAAYIVPLVQLVLALELVLNFLMDIYRPRVPDQEQRLAYDSRLFNLIADPGRVGHSIAEALNYQFGFEVSKTWFYQLLSRAMLPLLAVAVVVLLGMTSILIVPAGEKALVFRWGKVRHELPAGHYLKLPWPIETAQRFDVETVHELRLGAGAIRSNQAVRASMVNGHELSLWTQEHGPTEEQDFLVAVPLRSYGSDTPDSARSRPPAVNIIKLVVLVQYKIKDVLKYAGQYEQPERQLHSMAYREMVRYLASATLLEGVAQSDRPQAIMTWGRQQASAELGKRVRQAVEDKLGVEILYVGIEGIHPPATTGKDGEGVTCAKAYEEVLEAERRQEEKRYQAQAKANRILAKVAGSPAQALELALAIQVQRQMESMSMAAKGELAARIAEATSRAQDDRKSLDEEIRHDQLLGKAAPTIAEPAAPGQPTSAPAPGVAESYSDKQRLRQQYVAYLDQLTAIQADPSRLPKALEQATTRVDRLFNAASGTPAAEVAQASAERWATELAERARSESFEHEAMAFRAAPNIYMLDRWLDVWDEVLPQVNKYVFGVDRNRVELRVDTRGEPDALGGALDNAANK